MEEIKLTISNVKLSCKIRLSVAPRISFNTDKDSAVKHYDNFEVIKSKYTYIIFTRPSGGTKNVFHVNITKIPDLNHVSRALEELSKIIDEDFTIESKRLENLTCTHRAPISINLRQLFLNSFNPNITSGGVLNVRYSPEKFPGMFIKLKQCTVLLFANGRSVIIGASSEEDARTGISNVLGLVQNMRS